MSLYEDLQNQNKQFEFLETQLQRLQEDKKQTQQLIKLFEKKTVQIKLTN